MMSRISYTLYAFILRSFYVSRMCALKAFRVDSLFLSPSFHFSFRPCLSSPSSAATTTTTCAVKRWPCQARRCQCPDVSHFIIINDPFPPLRPSARFGAWLLFGERPLDASWRRHYSYTLSEKQHSILANVCNTVQCLVIHNNKKNIYRYILSTLSPHR